ncbi:hypothetical protein HF675_08030 [Serratia sp. JUb9]|uniref:hypothetical protein n=1 Tax=Serratia sp. JUb9 TaxID=2724469 RepID=UPI00164DEF24|nr:hypothetical protein [Serratia sp. JUb9]QNK33976.1 hypothetical protein HF675_08030 [Serratia sp. JUb9]
MSDPESLVPFFNLVRLIMIDVVLYLLSGLCVLYSLPSVWMNVAMLAKSSGAEKEIQALLRWNALKAVLMAVSVLCFGVYVNPSFHSITVLNFLGALSLLLGVSSILSLIETRNRSVGLIAVIFIVFGILGASL